MLFFIHGEDTYRSRQKLAEIKNEFKKKVKTSDFSIVTLTGEKLTMEEFREAVAASSFLTKKRLVVIENLISKNPSPKTTEGIAQYLDSSEFPQNNSVIFWEGYELAPKNKLAFRKTGAEKIMSQKNKRLLAKLSKIEYVWHFSPLKNRALNKWLRQQADKLGKQITESIATTLIALVGNNLWQLDQELKKLIAYCQQRPITLNDINLLVHGNFNENIFRLTDAIGSQNKKLALQLLNQQLANTASEEQPRIFSMIVRQFRLLLQIKDALSKQIASPASLAKQLGINPFVVSKILPQANKYTLAQLKNIYRKLLIIDLKIKTSQSQPELLLDVLIAEAG